MNREAVYGSLRGTLFRGGLRQTQVATIEAILDEAERRASPLEHVAYILATARHEPGDAMAPVAENLYYTTAARIREVWPSRFKSLAAAQPFVKNPRALANEVYNGRMGNRPGSDDGWDYRGRCFVGLTGRDNYDRAGRSIGLDLVALPEMALDVDIAVSIIFSGMTEGWFTGVSLADAAKVPGYEDDRAIVNGRDKAALIAGYAQAFETALRVGGYSGGTIPNQTVSSLAADEVVALRALSAWAARRPSNTDAVIAWASEMPGGAV